VQDFDWVRGGQSPNWGMMDEEGKRAVEGLVSRLEGLDSGDLDEDERRVIAELI
jgi:hypothetical protein